MTTNNFSSDRSAAWCLGLPALLFAAVLAHHPTLHMAHDASGEDMAAAVSSIAARNAAFHALVLLMLSAQAIGPVVVRRSAGARPDRGESRRVLLWYRHRPSVRRRHGRRTRRAAAASRVHRRAGALREQRRSSLFDRLRVDPGVHDSRTRIAGSRAGVRVDRSGVGGACIARRTSRAARRLAGDADRSHSGGNAHGLRRSDRPRPPGRADSTGLPVFAGGGSASLERRSLASTTRRFSSRCQLISAR